MPRVIISSGHTSRDPGSKANDLVEYEVARKIAKATLPYLRQHGIITLSVPPDLDLEKRVDWINKAGYEEEKNDLALEVHINEGGKSGIETWYEDKGGNNSQRLADLLLESTAVETGLPKQGSHSEYDHDFGSIAFLHDVKAITTLIECCYIDNEEDAKFLKDGNNIQKLARGISKGVLQYFNIPFRQIPGLDAGAVTTNQQTSPPTQPGPTPQQNNFPSALTAPIQPASAPPVPPRMSPPVSQPYLGMDDDFDDFGAMSAPPASPWNRPAGNMPAAAGAASPGFMSREDRKTMVTEMYTKILGREPNQNDLNYFLNIGISEIDLMKKMIDSQEHADLVKSRQEIIKTKEEANTQMAELTQLRATAEDQKVIIRNLHALLAQKNQGLAQIQQQLAMMQNYQNSVNQPGQQTPAETQKHNYKGTFLDKLFKAFSDLFE